MDSLSGPPIVQAGDSHFASMSGGATPKPKAQHHLRSADVPHGEGLPIYVTAWLCLILPHGCPWPGCSSNSQQIGSTCRMLLPCLGVCMWSSCATPLACIAASASRCTDRLASSGIGQLWRVSKPLQNRTGNPQLFGRCQHSHTSSVLQSSLAACTSSAKHGAHCSPSPPCACHTFPYPGWCLMECTATGADKERDCCSPERGGRHLGPEVGRWPQGLRLEAPCQVLLPGEQHRANLELNPKP